MKKFELNAKTASVLLALVIAARATSFMFSKQCLASMTAFSLISVRFGLAALMLLAVFHRHIIDNFRRADMLRGILFGTLYFCTLFCEHTGLKTTASGTASFLENMAIIIVPLAEAALARRLPQKKSLLRALLAVCGVAFLTVKGESLALSAGELFLLGAACFYSAAIISTNRLTRDGDAFNMGFFQVCTIAFWGTLAALVSGSCTLPATGGQWVMVFLLALVCTCFGFTLQPVAQSRVPSEKAALFCALSPMIAGLLGIVFLHEEFTPFTLAGEALILISLILR